MIAAIVIIAVLALLVAPAILIGGWLTMLCLGALAHIFGASTLAIGFWPSTLVMFIIFVLFGK